MLILYEFLLYIIGNLRWYYSDNLLIIDLNFTLLLIFTLLYISIIIYNFILDKNKKINLLMHLKIFFYTFIFSIFTLFISYSINNIIFWFIWINVLFLIYFYFLKFNIKSNDIVLRNLNRKIVVKNIIFLTTLYIILFILVTIYSFIFEQDKIAIDRYNFEQLDRVKLILKDIPEKDMKFYNIKQFNETYKADIKPIKNCYYLSFINWNKPYIFWFQLESMIYKFIYFWKNYAYPSYSIPREKYCFWEWPGGGGCHYTSKEPFIETISKPCE